MDHETGGRDVRVERREQQKDSGIVIQRPEELPAAAGVYVITYQGAEIVYVNFQGVSETQFIEVIGEAIPVIRRPGKEGRVLTLTNMREARYNPTTMKAVDAYAKGNEPFVLARSVIGLNDMKRVAFNTIRRIRGMDRMRAHDDAGTALAWLVEEGRKQNART